MSKLNVFIPDVKGITESPYRCVWSPYNDSNIFGNKAENKADWREIKE